MLFIIFFPAFLTAWNLFKTTGRFFSRVIVAVARAVSTKFITLICVFIFIKALTLSIETLALSLSLTVAPVKVLSLAVEALALPLSLTVAPVKVLSLAVEALTLTLSLTVAPVKVLSLAIEALALPLSLTVAPIKVLSLAVEALALVLSLTVKITIRIGTIYISLRGRGTVLGTSVQIGVQVTFSRNLSCSGRFFCGLCRCCSRAESFFRFRTLVV